MALDIGVGVTPADPLVTDMKSRLRALKGALLGWKEIIDATNGVPAWLTQEVYQRMASTRNFIEANKNSPGLAAAYLRQNPTLPANYNPGTEWTVTKGFIETLMTWIRNNWPEKTDNGYPAYQRWNATTLEHEDFSFPVNEGVQTNLFGMIDNIVNSTS